MTSPIRLRQVRRDIARVRGADARARFTAAKPARKSRKQCPKNIVERRTAEGRVLKTNNLKTRVLRGAAYYSLYGRVIRRTAKFVAHDELNDSNVGDLVRIEECRPMSRLTVASD